MILVKTFYAQNELRNYSYLIQDDISGYSWVIDPYDPSPIIDYIKKNGLVLKGILNTHQHFDHIAGNFRLADYFKAPICKLRHHENIKFDPINSLQVINTPGHTMDHQAFIWKQDNKALALFSGDTLFNSGVGNCRGGGNVDVLFETTESLGHLPPQTILYPGHDYRRRNLEFALTVEPENNKIKEKLKELEGIESENLPPNDLATEFLINPFFRLESEEIRQNVLSGTTILPETKKNKRELFKKLRSLRDNW